MLFIYYINLIDGKNEFNYIFLLLTKLHMHLLYDFKPLHLLNLAIAKMSLNILKK